MRLDALCAPEDVVVQRAEALADEIVQPQDGVARPCRNGAEGMAELAAEILRAIEMIFTGADSDLRVLRIRNQRQRVAQVFQRVCGARLGNDAAIVNAMRCEPAAHGLRLADLLASALASGISVRGSGYQQSSEMQ